MRSRFACLVLRLMPLALFLAAWQAACETSPRGKFLFATPSLVFASLARGLGDGTLLHHAFITASEALSGFAFGMILGSLTGFLLLYFPRVAALSRPYVFALGSVPIFAIAPMMIVWFGIGFEMKMAMAFFSTVFVAMTQAYQGGRSVDPDLQKLFKVYAASPRQTFWKLVFPCSLDWVFSSLRLNINLALLGAFIGEFIAAEAGLGYLIVKASGTYDVPLVLAGVVCIVALAALFNGAVLLLERYRARIISHLTVPRLLI
jgi:NitT/TauT family transport system permease protein